MTEFADKFNPSQLSIKIANSIEDAPNYRRDNAEVKPAALIEAVIVRNGTQQGNDTVDLLLELEDGTKVVTMVTGRILKSVTDLVNSK